MALPKDEFKSEWYDAQYFADPIGKSFRRSDGTIEHWGLKLGYIAGFLDGDGSITHASNRPNYRCLSWFNTNHQVIERIRDSVNPNGNINRRVYSNPKYRSLYTVSVYGMKAEQILRRLKPFLVFQGGPVTWSYVAGFFDAEGNLSPINRGWEFRLTNTNKNALEEIRGFVGYGKLYKRDESWRKTTAFAYVAGRGLDILNIIRNIKNEVIVKKKRVHEFLNWVERPENHLWKTYRADKKTIICRYGEGLSYRQISNLTDIPERVVYSVLKSAGIMRNYSEAQKVAWSRGMYLNRGIKND